MALYEGRCVGCGKHTYILECNNKCAECLHLEHLEEKIDKVIHILDLEKDMEKPMLIK